MNKSINKKMFFAVITIFDLIAIGALIFFYTTYIAIATVLLSSGAMGGAISFVLSLLLSFILLGEHVDGTLNIRKNIITLIVGSISIWFLISFLDNNGYLNSYKTDNAFEAIKPIEEEYPNSDELIEIKDLIKNEKFLQLSEFNYQRLRYVDPLETQLLSNQTENLDVKKAMMIALSDGYLNKFEENKVNMEIRKHLVNQLQEN